MIRLPNARDAWNSPEFPQVLKRELEGIDSTLLPLQQGLTLSSMVSSEPVSAIVLDSKAVEGAIHCRVSIIYSGIIAGCSCADDPTPVGTQTENCELLLEIDQRSAETRIQLTGDNR